MSERINRIILIGCGKTKYTIAKHVAMVEPENLYSGQLFKKRVEYAKRRGCFWAVLSAKYGLWWPDTKNRMYDETMQEKCNAAFLSWHVLVVSRLISFLNDEEIEPKTITVEIHAGEKYSSPLAEILEVLGFVVERPCKGMGIGMQLQAYTTGALSA